MILVCGFQLRLSPAAAAAAAAQVCVYAAAAAAAAAQIWAAGRGMVYAKHEPTFETLRPHPGTRARMAKLGNYDRMCLVIIIIRIEIAIVRFTVNVPDCSPTQWLLSSGADRDSKSSKKNSENNNIQKNNFVTDYGFRLWQAPS